MKKNIFVLLRIKDWLKNIIIFFPILFSSQLFNTTYYFNLFSGFIVFCILSSFVYVLNDILDIKDDQKHPIKKNSKPIASGQISIKIAYLILAILLILVLASIYVYESIRSNIISYLLIILIYNFGLKKIPYIEILILTLGYIIRTDSGSNIINVDSSILMLSSIFCIGCFFILLKRLSELNLIGQKNLTTRKVLKYYNLNLIKILSIFLIIILSFIFISYIYLVNIKLIFCFSLIILFLLRYYNLTMNSIEGENPITFIFSNKSLLILSFAILFSSLIIYV